MYASGSNTLDKEFSSLQTKVNQKTTLTEVINKIYPVGAIWFTTSYDSPASLFGGSWEQIVDRFLIGAGGRYGRGATGGKDSVKLKANQIPTLSTQILIVACKILQFQPGFCTNYSSFLRMLYLETNCIMTL